MQLIVYKHSGVTEIFFNIAYVRYWFLYKSFNTKKNFFKKKKEWTWALSSRGKSIWVPIFSVQFCTGTPLFPCFDVLTEAKSSTQEPNRRDFEDFLKSIYMSMTAGLTGSLSPTYVPVDYLHLSLKILPLCTAVCNFPGDLFGTRRVRPTAWNHCRCAFSTSERTKRDLKS